MLRRFLRTLQAPSTSDYRRSVEGPVPRDPALAIRVGYVHAPRL